MAKRRRLSPAAAGFAADTSSEPVVVRGPIADVARETSATAAAEELAQALTDARERGRLIIDVPLEAVQLDYLVRDRVAVDDDEMSALEASIEARGQQSPVELVALEAGRYGLISGWRRMKALGALHQRTGDSRFAHVAGLVRRPAERANSYIAMVEENEIRVGLSYFERARIVARSVEQNVFETDREALQALFATASRAKRSKIGSFLPIVRAFEGVLRFPHLLGEREGLTLSRAIGEDAELSERIASALRETPPVTPQEEAEALKATMKFRKQLTGSEKSEAQKQAAKTKSVIDVANGIRLSEDGRGRLILEGDHVDAGLKDRLVAWLQEGQ